MITYKKGDLFTGAPPEAFLAHACNAQGAWGSGIAAQFKERYPSEFSVYQSYCRYPIERKGGNCLLINNIACLITSEHYGPRKCPEERILSNTKSALMALGRLLNAEVHASKEAHEVHSPKFNAGLFAVPWEKTEAILIECLNYWDNINWTVWELE